MTEMVIKEEGLLKQIQSLKSDVLHWKSNHDAQVARSKFLSERKDLPIERVSAYHFLEDAISNQEKLRIAESLILMIANGESERPIEACKQYIENLKKRP